MNEIILINISFKLIIVIINFILCLLGQYLYLLYLIILRLTILQSKLK